MMHGADERPDRDDRDLEDLELLAQSYVLGELDEPAAERFEQRLADDQAARAAVARAVALGEALLAEALPDGALPDAAPLASGAAPRVRRIWPSAVAAAAMLVCAVGLAIGLKGHDREPACEDLISSWIEFGAAEESEIADEELTFEADMTDTDDAPSWLVTALEERNR